MAEKNARTLTQPSNRARPKDIREKKVVFKGVLDSPFRIPWPSVPLNLQNTTLALILQLLEGSAGYHQHRSTLNRKRKRVDKSSDNAKSKRLKSGTEESNTTQEDTEMHDPLSASVGTVLENQTLGEPTKQGIACEPPLLLQHLVFGINAVTKRLENQAQQARRPVIASIPEAPLEDPKPPLQYIFVCRADVDPPLLIDHLPHIVAAYNSSRPKEHIKLVPLPKGSELSLARTLGIRRVTVLGVDCAYPNGQSLQTMLEQVPSLTASWLFQTTQSQGLIPTHIKLFKTSAPKDMKAAKDARNQGKARAKERSLHGKELKALVPDPKSK